MKTTITLLLIFSSVSYARWATPDDVTYIIEDHISVFKINKDGTYKEATEGKYKILKEAARSSIGTMKWRYNTSTSTFRLIEGETINEGRIIPLDLKYVEDKPVTAQEQGFDSNNQVVASFPEIHMNSLIRFKYEKNVKKVPYHNFFSTKLVYGRGVYLKGSSDLLLSEMPLFLEVNDPDNILDIKQERENELYKISIRQKAPGSNVVVDEDKPLVNDKKVAWIVVSSSKSFTSDILGGLIEKYEKILEQPLPPIFENILFKAKQKTIPTDQINIVTSELASIMRYMGDWRAIDGDYVPRQLGTISKTLFGDCKDFATVTTAILRRMGYEAHVAFVERAKIATPLPTLPLDEFNHAIVHVKLADRVLWIDPTNVQSFATGIFDDIIDRKSLVLIKTNPHLEDIPKAEARDSINDTFIDVNDITEFKQELKIKLRSFGRANTYFAGKSLSMSRQSFDMLMVNNITNYANVSEAKVEYSDLSSRIVKPEVDIDMWIREKNTPMKTTMGLGKGLISPDMIAPLMSLNIKDRVSDYFLEQPSTFKTTVHWGNITPLGTKIQECRIDSPWLHVERHAKINDQGLTLSDITTSKRPLISASELQSDDFSKFQKKLKDCFEYRYVIFRLKNRESQKRVLSSIQNEK